MGRDYDQRHLVKHRLARVSLIVPAVLKALTGTQSHQQTQGMTGWPFSPQEDYNGIGNRCYCMDTGQLEWTMAKLYMWLLQEGLSRSRKSELQTPGIRLGEFQRLRHD